MPKDKERYKGEESPPRLGLNYVEMLLAKVTYCLIVHKPLPTELMQEVNDVPDYLIPACYLPMTNLFHANSHKPDALQKEMRTILTSILLKEKSK